MQCYECNKDVGQWWVVTYENENGQRHNVCTTCKNDMLHHADIDEEDFTALSIFDIERVNGLINNTLDYYNE